MEAVSVSNHQVNKSEIVCPHKCVLTAPWRPAAVPTDGTIPTKLNQIICSNIQSIKQEWPQKATVSILVLVFGTLLSDRLD